MKHLLLIIMIFTCSVFAEQTKTLERSFSVKPSQKIIIEDINAAKLLVKSWNKNEAYVKLRVKISSSDKKFEKEFINSISLKEESIDSELRITFDKTDHEGGGWSIFGIKFRFNYYEKKDITGEIYLPEKNNFQTNARYGELRIEDLKGEVELYGRSNILNVKNCPNLNAIENDYGNTDFENCGGNLVLKNRSNTTNIRTFNGPLKIEADYSNINVDNVSSKLVIESRSGTHQLSNIKGDVTVNSNYSNISIENASGFADVITRSGNLTIDKASGVKIDGDYCNIKIKSISGKTDRQMKIKSRSGTLEVENFNGNLSIENPYSGMAFRQVKGNLDINGRSSTIEGYDITGNWRSNTEYVDIKIRDLSAKSIDITNRSNPVTLSLKTVPNQVRIENEYGGVKIDMPAGYNGDIEMNATYGEIETNLPVSHKKLGSSAYAIGRAGSGQGKLYIETKSGNIEVYEPGKSF